MPRPIKLDMPQFKTIEIGIQKAIFSKFGVVDSEVDWEQIKEADNILLASEARDIMHNTDDWADLPEPRRSKIVPRSSNYAKMTFMYAFQGLMNMGYKK